MTFYDYISDFRLEEAKMLLDSKADTHQHSIEEIATKAGFNSYATFLRSFANNTG
jgi:transcriptional regulator GlxA family with amidase domain